jgi:hypothetical protein
MSTAADYDEFMSGLKTSADDNDAPPRDTKQPSQQAHDDDTPLLDGASIHDTAFNEALNKYKATKKVSVHDCAMAASSLVRERRT